MAAGKPLTQPVDDGVRGVAAAQSWRSDSARLWRYVALLAAVWTMVIGASLVWSLTKEDHNTQAIALAQAKVHLDEDLAFRQWAASHGGVYVPVDESTPPSPHLAHVPDRDVQLPSGKRLTLMPPAHMVRQLHEQFAEPLNVKGRTVSLRPLRPENAPDPWERKALLALQRGEGTVHEYADIGGAPHLRLMEPMVTSESCLKCHGHQGYRVGDVGGGVAVAVPLAPIQAVTDGHKTVLWWAHGGLWLLGLAGVAAGARGISRRIDERALASRGVGRL